MGFPTVLHISSYQHPSVPEKFGFREGSKIHQLKRTPRKKPYGKGNILRTCKQASAVSEEQIRATTVQSLSDVLLNRVQETEYLQVQEETVKNLAKTVEKEMFDLYQDTGIRYKNKYRSLIFNLKDTRNKIFFHRVVLGEITPQCLVQMSATEMAGQELSDWRKQERQQNLEAIEKAQKEFHHNQQKIKLTHKGLIEIETPVNEILTLEDLSNNSFKEQDLQRATIPEMIDTTFQHRSHLLDVNCLICLGKIKPSDQQDISQWTSWKPRDKEKKRNQKGSFFSDREMITEATKQDDLNVETTEMPPAIWKGHIQMFSLKQFKAAGFQLSGYSTHLCQELPNAITSKGFISPESVWEFVDLIWPASTKFHECTVTSPAPERQTSGEISQ
uniref:TFIIS central domain-containing protein n=1 Tax=Pyxicephalus adspersus TaxID=30357 RepID=A0AAV3AZS6_PYXAD|nr:TPA: hypothetical protein GDO54_001217 [Pyxicephalus adspersus]DBA33550.1 TPA: hypothetical protein GDO54_001217 [Pyxicephalus adspersus]